METIDWDDIYTQLFAYTDHLLKTHNWFRKKGVDSYLKGKQPHDYIAEAIEKFLINPEKYDSSANRSLINYLKLHIIRTLVGNDAKSKENFSSVDIFRGQYTDNEDEAVLNYEELLPSAEVFFDQDIDYNNIVSTVKAELTDDDVACQIFESVCCHGLKRQEVIREFSVSPPQFDSGMKRLRTVLKKVAKKYDLTQLQ